MPFVEWTDDFSVGVPEIDRDHQTLLGLLNDLYDAVEAGVGHEAVGRVLDGLALYVSYHFAHEEGLFLRAKYPGYERHRKQHLALTDTVKEIYTEFQSGRRIRCPSRCWSF